MRVSMPAIAVLALPMLLLAGCGNSTKTADKLVSQYTLDRTQKGSGWPSSTLEFWGNDPFFVTLWSANCATCESQLANLETLAAKGKYKVVVLDMDAVAKPGGTDILGAYLASHQFKSLRAVKATKSDHLYDTTPGYTYFYDKKGLVWLLKGSADFQSPEIQKNIAEATPK